MNANQPSVDADFDWTAGVVAIIGRTEESGLRGPVGVGFVVSDQGTIITCAHVLEQSDWPYGHWSEPIQVRFKATGRYADALVLEGRVMQEMDLAVMALQGALPEGVKALPLVGAAGSTGHTTYMWGYPAGYRDGLRGEGRVLGEEGRRRLQLTSTQTTRGYSGAPVWDASWKRVIGMITSGTEADHTGRLQYESFAIPAEALVEALPELLVISPLDAQQLLDMSGYDNRPLYGAMREKLSTGDTKDLAFDLGVDYEDLPGSTKSAKIRELIGYMERRDRVPELLEQLTKIRENVDWHEVAGVKPR